MVPDRRRIRRDRRGIRTRSRRTRPHLLLLARKPGPLEELATELRKESPNVEVRTMGLDLAADDAAAKIKAATEDLEVGLFIYNAGAEPSYGDFLDHEYSFLRGRLQRNFIIKTELLHHYGRKMREHGRGGIIVMGSIAGYFGLPGFALYGASKSFTHFLCEALWYELGKHGVHVLCPVVGPTDTPAMVQAYGEDSTRTSPAYVARESLNRLADGPIWLADDIRDQIDGFIRMNPPDRARFAAQMSAEFTKNKK